MANKRVDNRQKKIEINQTKIFPDGSRQGRSGCSGHYDWNDKK